MSEFPKLIDGFSLASCGVLIATQVTGFFDTFLESLSGLTITGIPHNPREWAEVLAWAGVFLLLRMRDYSKVRAARRRRNSPPVEPPAVAPEPPTLVP